VLRWAGVASVLLVACAGQAPLAPLPHVPAPLLSGEPPAVKARASEAPLVTQRSSVEPSAAIASLPAVSQGDIGGAGPLRLLDASASGAWVALCDGQPKTAKLVLGSGNGEEIDDLLARDASGRYVVVLKAGQALLIDASSGTRVDLSELGADIRRLRADYAEHRSLSFDARSQYLAYLKHTGHTATVVVRELAGGRERSFAAGPGELLSLRLSADARYVSFEALREDSNHNGKLDWPTPEDITHGSVCDKPALPRLRSFAYQGRGDAVVRGVIALDSGSVRDVPELVTPLGSSLLLRTVDGSLLLERSGKRSQLAPAGCAGRVLFADADRELVLAACTPPPPKKARGAPTPPPTGKREVWLFGAGYAKNLKSELYETSTDRDAVIGARLVPVYPGSEASLLDLERRELLPLATGSRVLMTSGQVAVIWQGSDLYRYDAGNKSQERLAHGVHKNPDFLQTGPAILLSPFVIVGGSAPALLSPGPALALTAGGMVLVPSSRRAAPSQVAIEGPLHWLDARLPPPDGPPR
jgi:hypothetical protein